MPKRKAIKTKPIKAKVVGVTPKLPTRYIRVWNKAGNAYWPARNAFDAPPDACADSLIYELSPP
jgi:hypothetical protein